MECHICNERNSADDPRVAHPSGFEGWGILFRRYSPAPKVRKQLGEVCRAEVCEVCPLHQGGNWVYSGAATRGKELWQQSWPKRNSVRRRSSLQKCVSGRVVRDSTRKRSSATSSVRSFPQRAA